MRRPIDEKTLQIQISSRVQLPEASIVFEELVHYLGDLGLQTNPEGWWALKQNRLNVLPGTCLVQQQEENGEVTPILVVAKPTIEHPGSLLLRFQNIPKKPLRSNSDLDASWIQITPTNVTITRPKTVNSTTSNAGETSEKTRETVTHVRLTRKGIVSKRLSTNLTSPVLGLPFWFTYAILSSTSIAQAPNYSGRPNGYHIRLHILYFARECMIPISSHPSTPTRIHSSWTELFLSLPSDAKVAEVPAEWTENSTSRQDPALTKRFEILIDIPLRYRSAAFRRARQRSLIALTSDRRMENEENPVAIPIEVLQLTPQVWQRVTDSSSVQAFISPLSCRKQPTSEEICIAATCNPVLAAKITDLLMALFRWFTNEEELTFFEHESSMEGQTVFVLAVIILDCIAQGAGYLANLGDVEESVGRWNPVYLC
jgi:hypothetical protein